MNMQRFSLLTAGLFVLIMTVSACGNARTSDTQKHNGNEQTRDNMPEQVQKVKIITSFGEIIIELFNQTPVHRDNFLKLASEGYYDGVLFHRVINSFMIQAGDPYSKAAQPGQPLGLGGPDYTLTAEIVPGLFHKKGALAAARQGDQVNPQRRSSGSQFYIVQGRVWTHEELDRMEQQRGVSFSPEQRQAYTSIGGTPHLDGGYTVFGQVIQGIDVVERIAAVQTGTGDRPLQDVSLKMLVLK